jgi:hypothetical protein
MINVVGAADKIFLGGIEATHKGIVMSIRTTWSFNLSAFATASLPFTASPQT